MAITSASSASCASGWASARSSSDMTMEQPDLGFIHRFVPPAAPNAPTLLLLHGTGGDEDDLIQLGTLLLPGAALLSPRGKVPEHGSPRFFRRLAMGVFDEA